METSFKSVCGIGNFTKVEKRGNGNGKMEMRERKCTEVQIVEKQ
jgi:hypothetical protein